MTSDVYPTLGMRVTGGAGRSSDAMRPLVPESIDLRAQPVSAALVATDELTRRKLDHALATAGIAVTQAVGVPDELGDEAIDVIVVFCGKGMTYRRALLSRLRRRLTPCPIVVVAPQDTPGATRATLEAGAAGLVFDGEIGWALGPTVAAVASGQVCVPAVRRNDVARPTLSRREKQVLGLVVMGLSNHEIASQLYLAESTVKCHLSSSFVKLGVRSRNEAVSVILDPEQKLGLGILGISSGSTAASEAPS